MNSSKLTKSESEDDKKLIGALDQNTKILWMLISKQFDQLQERLENTNIKVDKLEEIIGLIEDVVNNKEETIFKESLERTERSKNFIIFNHPDSKCASSNDLSEIKSFFTNSKVAAELPFEVNNIKVLRLDKSYKGNSTRPLLVKLNDAKYVSCVFKNKSKIFPDKSLLAYDLTITQRNYFKEMRIKLKNRIESGEENLKIKFYHNVPHIVSTSC